jgi:mono/diheme cytochrome c family protein
MIHARRNSALVLLALGASLPLASCGSSADNAAAGGGGNRVIYLDKASIPQDPAQQVFQQVCMSCHATGVGPVITGRDLPPDAVKLFVRNGSRGMPAFTQAMLDDQTLDAVAQLVAASKATPSPTAQ